MNPVRVAIVGTGGMGRETLAILCEHNRVGGQPPFEILGFLTNQHDQHGSEVDGIAVLGPETSLGDLPNAKAICAIGDPRARIAVVERMTKAGGLFACVMHPSAVCHTNHAIGAGTIVSPGAVITVNVRIGDHVILNNNVSISHDCIIEDFATIAPCAAVTGHVHIGYGAELGANCTILPRIRIGRGALVGAGAVVTRHVAPNTVVAGVPATVVREFSPNERL
jgi:sugar O-acyltransferase (sialic acid O-acetyltransferase NeuD family)